MNALRCFRILLPALAALAIGGCDRQAGTTDEHETTVAARVFLPDGTPAAGARVRIYAVGDTSQEERDLVFATSDGSVFLPVLPAGKYNLVITDDAGKGVVIDSLLSKGAGVPSMRSDTLREMGRIKGCLQVEPQHAPNIAWVQVLGLGLATNLDTAGCFLLEVPAGRVTLAALTREDKYTPTFRSMRTIPDSTVDVGVVRLVYTGIPVIEGLSVRYDSLAGVATVCWNRATAPGLRGYRLGGIGGLSSIDIDDLGDTVFVDTLFRPNRFDTTGVSREYTVVAVDSARVGGAPWRRVSLAARSPWTIPRGNFRDSVLGTVPAAGCDELDTLAGGLVCIKETQENGDTYLLHRSDTATVSVSSDGRTWRILQRFEGVLRVVAWRGRIWSVRGIPTGERAPILQGPGDTLRSMYGRQVFAPRYTGAVVESWGVDGTPGRADTLLDPAGALCYRFFVARDTLVLTRDSAANGITGASGPSGVLAVALDARRLADPSGSWEKDAGRIVPLEWREMDRSMTEMIWIATSSINDNGILSGMDSVGIGWGGLQWSKYGGALFARESKSVFPWLALPASYIAPFANRVGVRYRGDGDMVPPFITWKGFLLYWNGNDHSLHGLYRAR